MASITLRDLVEEQQETNMRLDEIDDRFLQFFDMLRADKLDMLEIMSELKAQRPTVPAVPPEAPATTPTEGAPEGLKFGFKTLVAGLGVALAASWAAYLDNIKSLFRNLRKGLSASLNKTFATVKSMIMAIVRRLPLKIKSLFVGLGAFFGDLGDDLKKSKVAQGVEKVKAFVGSIRGFFTGIANKIGAFGANLQKSERLKPIIEFFKQFGGKDGLFSKLFGIFRAIGRIFLPLTAIIEVGMGIFREVTALEEGAGFMDYLEAGVKGIIKGLGRLVTMPLDLLKSGISWIAGKLGFDQVEAMLDKFSFTELFDSMVDGVAEIVKKIFRFPIAVAKAGKAALGAAFTPGESATETFGKVFSEVMAGGDTAESGTVTASATSASINEPPPEEASRPVGRGAVARRQRMEARAAEEAGQAPTVTVINNTNAPTTTTNNSTTTGGGAPLPQPTQSNGSRADAYAGA